jgi:hypothetical protein
MVLASVVLLSLAGCGSGNRGNGSPVDPDTQPLAAGTYKLAFTAISTARLDAPIGAIVVSVQLPVGLSVATTTGGSGQIADASVTFGSAIQGQAIALGNYSASTRTAYLSMATPQDTFRGGEYLNLLFTVASGVSVTPNDIFALNPTYPGYEVIGLDPLASSTVVMTANVKTSLGVVR